MRLSIKGLLLCLAVGLLSVTSAFGAEPNTKESGALRSRWYLEAGTKTGISYDHRIGKHFTLRASTGLLVYARLQPYTARSVNSIESVISKNSYSGYGGYNEYTLNNENGKKRVIFEGEYYGLSPYIEFGARWYPRPGINNSGFALGTDLSYIHPAWSLLKPKYDPYKITQAVHLSVVVEYQLPIVDCLNLKFGIRPTVGAEYARSTKSIYGLITLMGDIGITYSF